MAYADIYNAATDALIFQPRCVVAGWTLANAIQVEAGNTPNHVARLDWSNKVLRDQLQISPKNLAQLVLQDSSIAANPGASTDAAIQTQMNSLINVLISIG